MKFCKDCDFMLYLTISKEDQSLLYYCRSCGNVEIPDKINIIASKTSFRKDKKSWGHFVNKYTKMDPTLFRDSIMQCPNQECRTNIDKEAEAERQIIHLRYDEDNMKYLYLCFHCDFVWNTDS